MLISNELFTTVVITPSNKSDQPPFELHGNVSYSCGPYDSKVVAYKFGYKGSYPKGFDQYINAYELAHMCKEWAFKQGFNIVVKKTFEKNYEWIVTTLEDVWCANYCKKVKHLLFLQHVNTS